ncbi:MAG: hypothetical protein AUK02_07135 [Anaerolineae bacterium CG2_30_58_95]|nr:MAG: hypothetical protein AUK02_07135 [Anaerolineae bacterium CG2_30_58_95]
MTDRDNDFIHYTPILNFSNQFFSPFAFQRRETLDSVATKLTFPPDIRSGKISRRSVVPFAP